MKMERKIRTAAAYAGITLSELARRIGTTPQNFNSKLKRETFTVEELEQIAEVLGASYNFGFTFPDGTEI